MFSKEQLPKYKHILNKKNLKMMHYLVSLIILVLTAAPLHTKAQAAPAAQKDSTARRVLSYAQFVKEMVECTAAVYRLENAELRTNPETDREFMPDLNMRPVSTKRLAQGQAEPSIPIQTIKASVDLNDVRFDGRPIFRNMKFTGNEFSSNTISGLLEFRDCTFGAFILLNGKGLNSLRFHRCKIAAMFCVRVFGESLVVKGCTSEYLRLEDSEITDVEIQASNMISGASLIRNTLKNVLLRSVTFGQGIEFNSTVQREIIVDSCKIDSGAYFYASQFPHKNTSLSWSQIAGKNALLVKDTITYRARTDTELADERNYNNLISIYTDFLSLYKTRGDQESYNACYVEMKQIHTRRAGYLYRQRPQLESWFDWRLNQLLEVFSDYGTNAAKGLIYVFYVIIAFATLYLVFPSEVDNLSRTNSFRMFDVVIGYFSTNARLASINEHKRRRALDDLQNFRTTLEVSRTDVPAFIAWLGRPLYGLNKAYLSASAWLMERFDIVPGRWQELSQGRKFWTSMAIGAYMLGFLAWGVVMRFVNAFALSINAFVTLGYGEIQARGVARYLAVLEGAVGWFLLSIFSVTLISQLLQ